MENKVFVYAKKDIPVEGGVNIQKNQVGILKKSVDETSEVFFVYPWEVVTVANSDIEQFGIDKVGDNESKKICNICHKLIDSNLFEKNQNGKNNRSVRRPSCKECRKQLNGTNMSRSDVKEWIKTKPSLEPFECPICQKRTIAGLTSKIVMEHDHKTGKVRGWVCDSCNTGIGRFKDDVKILKRAIEFLKPKS